MGKSNPAPEAARPGATARSRSVVLAARILLLVVAAGAVAVSIVVGRARDRAAAESSARYTCPMHPEVTAGVPGECPICGMALEPVSATGSAIANSTFQIYDFVRRRGFGQDLRAPAWVENDGAVSAVLYQDVLPTLAADERVVFTPSATPKVTFEVHPSGEPATTWDASTSRVRFRADADAHAAPRPGDVGWVRLAAKRREVEVIPYSAVLEEDDGPYVLVATNDGRTLSKRSIEIGRVVGGMAIVLAGLRQHERVLVRSAFFVDAERRLRHEAAVELAP
ncbi:MAG TPA: heavy metal-binding domain-containing protein [Polyangiaceae bacterium]|nr:heavy metal-binding domain-containing protein [Polyangiaceae bacterium]